MAVQFIDDHVPYYYYMLLLTNYGLYQIALYSMFVAVMAFFARISDPAVGGTYMTLLNTLSNLGGNWPTTVVLWLVDYLTWKRCSNSTDNDCSDGALKDVRNNPSPFYCSCTVVIKTVSSSFCFYRLAVPAVANARSRSMGII